MGLIDILTTQGSKFTYPANGTTPSPYPQGYIPPTNLLATPINQGGLSLHANGTGPNSSPGASIAGTSTALFGQVNAAWQTYKDGDPTNQIPIPVNNPGADLDLEGIIPPQNSHGNPNLLNFYSSQNLPYDQNAPN